ncbi:MAG: TlpA disulfide reductase family protein [Gammaproteobacteria bacterium]
MSVILFTLLVLSAPSFAAVDFVLPDVDGKQYKLSDYRGKWVVVNYWATWCGPCLEEIPSLDEFHAKHKDQDAVVLGVNAEDIGIEKLRTFIDEHFMKYPVLRGDSGPESPLGPIYGLPTTYLISPTGEIVTMHLGALTGAALEKIIEGETVGQKQTSVSEIPRWKFWKRHEG